MNKSFQLSEIFSLDSDYQYSMSDPHSFWNEVSDKYVHWDRKYDTGYGVNPVTNKSEWFQGGLINACYNALDKNIKNGKRDEIAFVHEIPIRKMTKSITYQEIYDRVCVFSRALRNLGVGKGDVVLIYMHNSFESIITMLSCARIGAIHNVTFGGCLADSLSACIRESKPKVVICSTYGFQASVTPHSYSSILKEALDKSTYKPPHIVIFNRKDISEINNNNALVSEEIPGSIDWEALVTGIEPLREYLPVESQHPLYFIYSSGTTSKPKGVVKETGGTVVALNYTSRSRYYIKEGRVLYTGSHFGWVSSHSFVIYGILFEGGKSIFLEGPYSDPSKDLWELVSRNRINSLFISPETARKLVRRDPSGLNASKYDLSSLKFTAMGADKVNKSVFDYIKKITKVPVFVEYWQTETGWQITQTKGGLQPPCDDENRGTLIGKVVPGGYQLKIVTHSDCDASQTIELPPNEIGDIVFKLPLLPGHSTSLFGDDEFSTLYNNNYLNKYKGYFSTGDLGYYDSDCNFYYVSRADDILSTGDFLLNCSIIEYDIINHPNILECCLVGRKDPVAKEIPVAFIVLKKEETPETVETIKQYVSNYLLNAIKTNILFKPTVIIVKNIPKNSSGKTVKSLIKSIINDEPFAIPSTIENPNVIYDLIQECKI